MKPLKLFAIVLCLFLIGVSPKNSGQKLAAIFPGFSQGVVSLHSSLLPVKPDSSAFLAGDRLAQGERIFDRYCSGCHTVRLVWASGLLSGEADSVVTAMSEKAGLQLEPSSRKQLLEFLQSRLPRQ